MRRRLNIFLIVFLLSYHVSGRNSNIKSDSIFKYRDTTISLGYGFIIYASRGELYEYKENSQDNFTTYTSIRIIKDKKIIFSDTNSSEYEFDHNLHPFFRRLEGDKFEFLLGINDRPNINFFLHLIVDSESILKRDSLPVPINESKIIRSDGLEELAGFRDYNYPIGDSMAMVTYTPMLIYVYRKDGIILDSVLTSKINIEIYGKFEGYHPYKMKLLGDELYKEIEKISSE